MCVACDVIELDKDVDTGVSVEFDPGPTSAAGLVALVVLDCKTQEMPPITCARNVSS